MSRLWMFRNWSNFTISFIGVSLTGYYINNIFKERQFQTPVIDESLKILGKHHEVRTLAGFPLTYIGTSTNVAVPKDNNSFYSFKVGGPKATLTAELTAEAKTLNEFLESDIMKKTSQLLETIATRKAQKEAQITELRSQKVTSSNRSQINRQLEDALLNLKNLQSEQSQVQQNRIRIFNQFITKYYVPEKQNLQELESNQDNPAPIPDHWKMWSISKLDIEMPNGNKVFVVPSQNEQPASKTQLPRWTYASLNNKLKLSIDDLSSEEVSAYSQQKTNSMYMKYNSHRLTTILLGLIFGAAFFLYHLKHKLVPLNRSVFLNDVKMIFQRHPKIKSMGKFQWSQVTRGGRRAQQVDVEVDVIGQQRGFVKVEATYNPKSDEYTIKKAQFVPVDKKVNPIDLLKP